MVQMLVKYQLELDTSPGIETNEKSQAFFTSYNYLVLYNATHKSFSF